MINTKSDKNPVKKTTKKTKFLHLKNKKVKSKNKQTIVHKITIQNKGNFKSGKTTLPLCHIRNKVKLKSKL